MIICNYENNLLNFFKMSKRSSVSDFEIIGKLGEGSFGTVFKVRRIVDNNIYVMKIIKISQMDKRGQQESINEVRILASLDNPYIVRYFDSFIEKNTLHIIMEFCDKGDLSNQIRIQSGRLFAEAKIWKYFIQMCMGLEYIHSKKILHRDIKSMNVFLVKEDSVRIGDLGVAKVLSSTAAFAHTTVGTPYYLSPELCEEKPYNVKSDVWALGCVLYEMCTLKHPFDANNQGALILKILRANYSPISSQYSPELRDLVTMCLHKDYKKRPSVSGILKLPGMRDRANSLNIPIPNGSVLSEIPAPKVIPAPYQSRMDVIEEEKVMKINSDASKAGDIAKKPVLSKSPSAQGRISAGKPDIPRPAPVQPKVNKPIENPKQVPKYAPVPEIPKFHGNQKKAQDEPIKFDQPRPISALNAHRVPANIKSAPKQKVLKPAIPQYRPPQRPKEIPQSARRASADVNKKLSDIESIPKLPEYPKKISVKDLREEAKQESPVKPKLERPKLVKIETKKHEFLNKPVISLYFLNEEKPVIQKPQIQNKIQEPQFSVHIEESQLSTKINSESSEEEYEEMTTHSLDNPDTYRNYEEETIPISVTQNFDNSIYRVHYVKPQSTPSEAISSDSEDQAYEEPSSSSSEDQFWSSGEEEEEEDEEFSKTRQGMQIKLVEYAKKEEEFEKMINQKKKELIKKVGKSTYEEIYQYFKAKANEKSELTTQEEAAIEEFVSLKISSENIEVIYTMYKILHLEDELARFREESSQLQKKLS
ncbi:unnamed protein product [Blepharisma stoltei]|uniref:non-specific serine/threonine protein kinase n=1 Tax=Blepharisma stoltei TaxID=1481888 RepID=A0AAU9JR38_9CILI|nr:unnamed protein product [Blepharisma stoltei]